MHIIVQNKISFKLKQLTWYQVRLKHPLDLCLKGKTSSPRGEIKQLYKRRYYWNFP